MTIPFVPIVAALSLIIPKLAELVRNKEESPLIEKIADVAKTITKTENPLDILKILEADSSLRNQFEGAIDQIQKEFLELTMEDRQSARQRDIAILEAGRSNRRADVMVVAAAFGLICCLMLLVFFKGTMPGEAVGIISTVAGIFGSCLKDAYAFEFGSSRGSKNKDEQVRRFLTGGNKM